MRKSDMPKHWKLYFDAHGWPTASDFTCRCEYRHGDGTLLLFVNCFVVCDFKRGEWAVLTEHCGYHVLPHSADVGVWVVNGEYGTDYTDVADKEKL